MYEGKYCFQRRFQGGRMQGRTYHKYLEEKDGPKCNQKLSSMVVISSTPQNLRPCRHCFKKER